MDAHRSGAGAGGRRRQRVRTPPPPPPGGQRAHEIDYEIFGEEMQFVEIELDPGETVIAEAGGMMYMTPGIQMETVFGDAAARRSAASWAS